MTPQNGKGSKPRSTGPRVWEVEHGLPLAHFPFHPGGKGGAPYLRNSPTDTGRPSQIPNLSLFHVEVKVQKAIGPRVVGPWNADMGLRFQVTYI